MRLRALATGLFVLGTAIGASDEALAQGSASRGRSSGPPRWEFSGGVAWVGGYDLGSETANLTSSSGGTTTLFTARSRLEPAAGVLGRIGFQITPSLAVEGGLRFTKPVFEVRTSTDFEGAPDTTITERMSQYVFDGSAVWHFVSASSTGRVVPFVYGGAGYLRELHEGDTLVEEGAEFHMGGGVKWWLGSGRRRFGVRGEAGLSIRDGGFDVTDGRRVLPTVYGSLIYAF